MAKRTWKKYCPHQMPYLVCEFCRAQAAEVESRSDGKPAAQRRGVDDKTRKGSRAHRERSRKRAATTKTPKVKR